MIEERFGASKGVPMKEWFSMDPQVPAERSPLAREAMTFMDT